MEGRLIISWSNCFWYFLLVIMGKKKKTLEIFGSTKYIDVYSINESEADHSTVPIIYEGRTTQGTVDKADSLNAAVATAVMAVMAVKG